MNAEMLLAESIARQDASGAEARASLQRWLRIVQIAVPALLRAAAGGNVTCLEACREIAPLLPKSAVRREPV